MAARAARPLAKFSGHLVLAGAGKMGGAMLEGWLARGLSPKKIIVVEPSPSKQIKALARRGVRINPKKASEATVIVVAVKPQSAPDMMPLLAGAYAGKSSLVLSVMAGRTIGFIEKAIPGSVVRAMPNTPAAIGRGITVAVANAGTSAKQRKLATELLAATGGVEWVKDETLMDAVTAVSGSGPAYVFLLAEELAKAGVAAGLPAALAARLARDTVAGSGELLHRSPLDPAVLRQNVTSPGGTTAAALNVLMGSGGLEALMIRAIEAAAKRSRELAG